MMRFDTFRFTTRWLPFAALTGLAAAAGVGLVREATWTRPLPPMPVAEEAPPPAPLMIVARDTLRRPVETAHYAVIAVRNLFSASRGEQAENTVTASNAPGSKLFLHGVVVDGPSSRAYLEDPDTQRVFGYALGDAVGGGKLVRILDDRVVIRRPDGLVEIMLRDPAKPQP
ncbi:MAG TPA: type II secretion system protein N, partial [Methylomirabilota bacterium]|nr:type II secretion system protein N [Methylomirabilota bacterium]